MMEEIKHIAFAGEKTPAKASFLQNLKRKNGTPTRAQERELNLGKIVRGQNVYDTLSAEFLLRDSIYCFHQLKANDTLLHLGNSDDTLYQAFYDFALTGNIGKFEEVNNLILDSLMADTTSAEFVNQNIYPKCTSEENKQLANAIYLNKAKNDSDTTKTEHYEYDSTEVFQLNNVAYQNPMTGGAAVYQSRAMLFIDILDEVLEISSKSLVIHNSEATKNHGFKLYPNPNNGNFTLEYDIEDTSVGVFYLYDLSGRLVKYQVLNSQNKIETINATELNAGAYYYLIKIGDNKVKTDKLIIVK